LPGIIADALDEEGKTLLKDLFVAFANMDESTRQREIENITRRYQDLSPTHQRVFAQTFGGLGLGIVLDLVAEAMRFIHGEDLTDGDIDKLTQNFALRLGKKLKVMGRRRLDDITDAHLLWKQGRKERSDYAHLLDKTLAPDKRTEQNLNKAFKTLLVKVRSRTAKEARTCATTAKAHMLWRRGKRVQEDYVQFFPEAQTPEQCDAAFEYLVQKIGCMTKQDAKTCKLTDEACQLWRIGKRKAEDFAHLLPEGLTKEETRSEFSYLTEKIHLRAKQAARRRAVSQMQDLREKKRAAAFVKISSIPD
jgi:hypothetical protein